MVNFVLAATVCFGALLSLQVVAGCGFHIGGCHGRPPCGGHGRPPCGFGRPPCGRPPCGFPFGRPPCGRPPCGFPFGRPPCGRPPCGPPPRPPPPPPPPCIFGKLIHGILGGGRPCGPPPRAPTIQGRDGPFSWITKYIGNVRYIFFTFAGPPPRTIKYQFKVGAPGLIPSLLIRFKKEINYRPPIVGSLGPFSWVTKMFGRTRYIVFTYRGILNGRFQVKTFKYEVPFNLGVPDVMRFLGLFKVHINFNVAPPKPPQPPPKPQPPQPKPTQGSEGGFTWKTTWINRNGKVTFYYNVFENGRFVVKSQTYSINDQNPSTINEFLSKFKSSFNYQENPPQPTTDGEHYNYKVDDNGRVIFTWVYRKNGKYRTGYSKSYQFDSGDRIAQIKSFYEDFKGRCAAKKQEADDEDKPIYSEAHIRWSTQGSVSNDDYAIKITMTAKNKDGKSVSVVKVISLKDTTREAALKEFKDNVKDGTIVLS